jgi:YidC/Oxa1 family membrane protein insertase
MAKTPLEENITGGWIAMVQHYFISAWIPAAHKQPTVSTPSTMKNE